MSFNEQNQSVELNKVYYFEEREEEEKKKVVILPE